MNIENIETTYQITNLITHMTHICLNNILDSETKAFKNIIPVEGKLPTLMEIQHADVEQNTQFPGHISQVANCQNPPWF